MDRTAQVIIVGAGVVGCSIAYHLAKMGCPDVTVLEKNYTGSGSTENCAGGIRQQFSLETNIRLSIESVRFFERFEEETGRPADFRQNGYIMAATTEEELQTLQQNVNLQRKLGLEVHLLSPEETGQLIPRLNIRDIKGATYCPTDGYADPYSVVQGFAAAARKLGVRIHEETEVTGVKAITSQGQKVLTSQGDFATPVVVNAAGPYAGRVGKMMGLEIPVRPSRRHIFVTAPFNEISQDSPMFVDFHRGFWFRREGKGLIFGMRNPDEPEGFDTSIDWSFLPTVAEVAAQRLPLLENVGIMRGQAGLHADTPEANAIIGKVPGKEGLYLACGFSGHGFMHSPAVGRVMAELVLGFEPSIDISPLAPDRFKRPARQKEKCFI